MYYKLLETFRLPTIKQINILATRSKECEDECDAIDVSTISKVNDNHSKSKAILIQNN